MPTQRCIVYIVGLTAIIEQSRSRPMNFSFKDIRYPALTANANDCLSLTVDVDTARAATCQDDGSIPLCCWWKALHARSWITNEAREGLCVQSRPERAR
jgi:hypothetical protein